MLMSKIYIVEAEKVNYSLYNGTNGAILVDGERLSEDMIMEYNKQAEIVNGCSDTPVIENVYKYLMEHEGERLDTCHLVSVTYEYKPVEYFLSESEAIEYIDSHNLCNPIINVI
jgi:hypothetical protein